MTVLEAIRNRRSVRAYSSREVPEEVMGRLRQALRWAPSACNIQPWQFIWVTDPGLRQGLAKAAKNQMWMAEAPVTVVACGFPAMAYPRMGGSHNSIDIDMAIALDHLMLAAVAEGLGTCWIGAFFENQVKPLLRIPEEARVVAMTPVGYPASADLNHPVNEALRKPESQVFSRDYFDGQG